MADSAANAAAAEARAAAPHKPAPQQGQGSPAASSQTGSAAGASPPGSQKGSAPAAGTQQQQPRQQQQSQQQQRQPVSGESVRGWWAGPGAAVPSFEEARTVWQQYVEMAGACVRACSCASVNSLNCAYISSSLTNEAQKLCTHLSLWLQATLRMPRSWRAFCWQTKSCAVRGLLLQMIPMPR